MPIGYSASDAFVDWHTRRRLDCKMARRALLKAFKMKEAR